MSAVNDTKFHPAVFLLTGIPGLEDIYVWISIPFCMVYATSVLVNLLILLVLHADPPLHEPMYIFLSFLAITDLGLSISTMPTTLSIFWFNSREISHDSCFAQLFFIHYFIFTESSLLFCMAFDRFVAICKPLRYASILTPVTIAKMGLGSLLKGAIVAFPDLILLKQYQYCQANTLSHSYCLHQEVMTMACSDISPSIIYGFFITISSAGLDLLLILLSYVMILKTVLSMMTHKERIKALDTCVSHVCVVLISFLPGFSLSVIYRFSKSSSPLVQSVLGHMYLLIPPLMNPIVYSVKTQPIRSRIISMFFK